MNGGVGDMHWQFEQYLDGTMDEPRRRQFEHQLADRADLQRELRAQQSIDASIRRSFPVPGDFSVAMPGSLNGQARPARVSADDGDAGVAGARPPAGSPSRTTPRSARPWTRLTPWRAAAAVIALGALGWIGWSWYQSSPLSRTPVERLYFAGSHADWQCRDEAEFIRTFQDKLGQGLRLTHTPKHVEIRGLKYAKVISPYTVVLCAKIDCRDAFVLVDVLAADKKLKVRERSGLNLFRRELGKLVLYELTPLDSPHLLDALELATAPPPDLST